MILKLINEKNKQQWDKSENEINDDKHKRKKRKKREKT